MGLNTTQRDLVREEFKSLLILNMSLCKTFFSSPNFQFTPVYQGSILHVVCLIKPSNPVCEEKQISKAAHSKKTSVYGRPRGGSTKAKCVICCKTWGAFESEKGTLNNYA